MQCLLIATGSWLLEHIHGANAAGLTQKMNVGFGGFTGRFKKAHHNAIALVCLLE